MRLLVGTIYYLLTEREVCTSEINVRAKTEVRYLTSTDRKSEVNKLFIIWLYWNIIDISKVQNFK